MRTKKTILNSLVAMLMYSINIIFGFIAQKIFITTLGNEYLGVNGLFTNILSILAVVELGFGNAIIFHLYKPLAENNEKEVNLLMKFYKKTYNIIALIIFILGLISMFFLGYIIGSVNIKESIYLLYFLALFDIVSSYLLTYKRSILYANQETYIINYFHIGYIVLLNIFEILFLLKFRNYIIYLLIKIFFRILENVAITLYVNNKYPFILKKVNENLDVNIEKDIYKKVKGLFFHKIGGSIVYGTDNIIISKLFGVVTVGLYSNYYMIINSILNLLYQVFNSITSSVGNLLLEKNVEKSYITYKNILFINSWIFCFCSACLISLVEPFIKIWLGDGFILNFSVLVALVLNFYFQGMRRTSNTFKEAAGIFYEDRYVPLIESTINIIASIVLGKIFGLAGVFMGTIVSSLPLFLYSYPVYVFQRLFNKKYLEFILIHLKYLFISFIAVTLTYLCVDAISISNIFLNFIVKMITVIVLINIINLIFYFKTNEFKYYMSIINKFIKKIKKN